MAPAFSWRSARMPKFRGCVLAVALLGPSGFSKSFTWSPDSAGRDQFEFWLDPYYTAVNVAHDLSSEPIERLDSDKEGAADWWLVQHFLHPRDLLLEGSVNPMPIAGWALRKWQEDAYGDASVRGTNLVQAITEGFPEPWAVSLFVGNVVNLVSSQDTSKINGMGYSGLLVSWGNMHLVENRLVREDWLETEIKIKGDDIRSDRKLGWSFRCGWREHFDPDIRDAIYGSIVRRRTDFQYQGWDPLRNSSLELRMDLDRKSLPSPVPLRIAAIAGKRFPFAKGVAAFCLSVGAVDELHPAYVGRLRPYAPRGLKLVLQPNVDW
jgi:hypothetical protein